MANTIQKNQCYLSALFLNVFICGMIDCFAYQVVLVEKNVSTQNLPAVKNWLESTLLKVPALFFNKKSDHKIYLRFSNDLAKNSTEKSFYSPFCPGNKNALVEAAANATVEKSSLILGQTLPHNFWGYLSNTFDRIEINSLFVSEIAKGEKLATKIPCGHQNYYRYAQAVLIHELMHVMDLNKIIGYQISKSETFLSLADWSKRGLLWTTHEDSNFQGRNNPAESRSLDTFYEFNSPSETLANNFEYFILDPEYSCRRPTLSHFFQKLLNYYPIPNCQLYHTVPVLTASLEAHKSNLVEKSLDWSRLYQIHYLLAGPGDGISSQWGHAMYRLVFCKEGKTVGPDCVFDIDEHVVVSFRAQVNEETISNFKGLTGKYPSQLFLLSMGKVWQDYTRGELRSLHSYPLKINELQQKIFLERILERYWSYQGKYYFISNNCAVESLNLLRGIDYDVAQDNFNAITPSQLRDFLFNKGLIENISEGPSDLEVKQEKGHYFPSANHEIKKDFQEFRNLELSFGGSALPSHPRLWIIKSTAHSRRLLFKKWLSLNGGEPIQALAKSQALRWNLFFISAEELALIYQTSSFYTSINRAIEANSLDSLPKQVRRDMETLSHANRIMNPWQAVSSGYGIPLQRDRIDGLLAEHLHPEIVLEAHMRIQKWILETFKDEAKEINESSENLLLLKDKVAKLINQGSGSD